LLPRSDERRGEHLIDLGSALHEVGELGRARSVFTEARESAHELGDGATESRAVIGTVYLDTLTRGPLGGLGDVAQAEIAKLEELGHEAGLAEGWFVAAILESWVGRTERSGRSYERAIEHARRSGNRRLMRLSNASRLTLSSWGFMRASEGLRECDALLADYAGTSIEPWLRNARAKHLSFLGDADGSRAEAQLSEELYEQYGNELIRAASRMTWADNAMRAGRLEDAEATARDGIERPERLGDKGYLSSTCGIYGEALYRSGRYAEADEWAQRTRELASKDDFDPNYRWRALHARVLARRGEFAEAERLAREAVAIVEPTDWYPQRGEAAAALAEVLELAGNKDEARKFYEQARGDFARKESLPDVKAMGERLAQLDS
jgi:hypothetical protein